MPLPRILKTFLAQSACWTGLCLFTELICRFVLRWPYPYTYPAMPFGYIFGDFHSYIPKFRDFHSSAFFHGAVLTYPAPAVVLFRLFIPPGPVHTRVSTIAFIITLAAAFVGVAVLFCGSLIRRGVAPRSAGLFTAGSFLLSFPIFFELHQGNIEAAVWLCTSAGLWAFWSGRYKVAAAALGYAAALKLFPFLLLGLFVAKKLYRQLSLALLVAGVSTAASLWLLCPDLATSWRGTANALGFLQGSMLSAGSINMGFDHGIFSLIKLLTRTRLGPADMPHLLHVYFAITAVAGILLFFFRIRFLPLANQMICLTLASIMLPPISFDYTLIHLYTPFALFTHDALQGKKPSFSLRLGFVLLAFLLSFQSELIWHGNRIAGQCKSVGLVALFCIVLIAPLRLTPQARAVELPGPLPFET